jgi:hypothetical protein
MLAVQSFEYNGQSISRMGDGFINLTQMCVANGKRLDNYLRLKQTQGYIDRLSSILDMRVLKSVNGGSNPGTWGHPSLAINLAGWISSEFQAWFNTQVVVVGLTSTIDFSNFGCDRADSLDCSGFVYLARNGNTHWYKIGISKQPYRRMTQLQVGTPLEITLVERVFTMDAPKLEKALNEYYQAYWMRGEWFDLPTDEVVIFDKIAGRLDRQLEVLPCLPQ